MTDASGSYGGNGDRFDRIEQLLATVAASQAASAQRMDRIEAAQERFQVDLAETRAIADSNARSIAETRAIADSNARSIQAWEGKFQTQDRDIDRLALVAADVESGTRTLAIAVRDIFAVIINRLNAVEARLPDEGTNGDQN